MAYVTPSIRSAGYLVKAAEDWNIIVNDIIDLEARIAALEGSGGISTPTNVPVGGIVIWSGSIASIPSGWALCNGSSGTPDLRNKFVIGAGSTYAVGATGGATTHVHGVGSTVSNGSHNHGFSGSTGSPSGTVSTGTGSYSAASGSHTHTISGSTGSGGAHTHGVPDTDAASSLPPYYALAYIMRTT